MNAEINSPTPTVPARARRVKIIGIGTAGSALVEPLISTELAAASFAVVNSDGAAPATIAEHHILEMKGLRGLGTGGDPERGRKLAEEHIDQLKACCADTDVVFLIAGLGGGTGSGMIPVLARVARASGVLVLAFVTLPFDCEGTRRQQQARLALEQLKGACDGVICLPNQEAFQLLDEHASVIETFRATAQLIGEGVRGVWRLLMRRSLIEIHFEELCQVLRERHGESYFATVEAAGVTRARDVIERLPGHPLLKGGIVLKNSTSVLVSIIGGPDLSMAEINRVMADVNQHCQNARVIMGAAIDENFQDRLAVTIIANQLLPADSANVPTHKSPGEDNPAVAEDISAELLHPTEAARPKPRFIPPAPELSLDQREHIISKHTGKPVRPRKGASGPRLRQTTLPLDIVNKGRFDKSEPTIHKGEDLDLPTYVRRGVALN